MISDAVDGSVLAYLIQGMQLFNGKCFGEGSGSHWDSVTRLWAEFYFSSLCGGQFRLSAVHPMHEIRGRVYTRAALHLEKNMKLHIHRIKTVPEQAWL